MATVPRSAEAERHDPLLAELLGRIAEYNANADADLIRAAFDYACVHHRDQRRKSGEEFIASLRDGREVYYQGERVDDVTTHPATAKGIETIAAMFSPSPPPKRCQ